MLQPHILLTFCPVNPLMVCVFDEFPMLQDSPSPFLYGFFVFSVQQRRKFVKDLELMFEILNVVKLGIGGFNMGAAIALYSVICQVLGRYSNGNPYPITLSIAVGLSGWLPCSRFVIFVASILSFINLCSYKIVTFAINSLLRTWTEDSQEAVLRAVDVPILLCHGLGIPVPYSASFLSLCFLPLRLLNSPLSQNDPKLSLKPTIINFSLFTIFYSQED